MSKSVKRSIIRAMIKGTLLVEMAKNFIGIIQKIKVYKKMKSIK